MKTAFKSVAAAIVLGLMLGTTIAVRADTLNTCSEGNPQALYALEDDYARDIFAGTWKRSNVAESQAANLVITKTDNPRRMYVRMRAFSGGNQGEISGMAELYKNTAIVHFEDETAVYGRMTLTLCDDGISVEYMGEHAPSGLGNGVTLDGLYVKGQPHYVTCVAPERAFGTSDNLKRAIALVGDKNFLNLHDMFANAVVVENEPFRYSGFMQGAGMEAKVRADKSGHLYIFGRNVFPGDKEMVFYTNDAACAHKLPEWLEFDGDEKDVLIIYKDVK